MSKRPVEKRLVHVFVVSVVIVLVGGGLALLNQWQQGPLAGHASDDSVVGAPTLPASYVDGIFRGLHSPMAGTGQAIEQAAHAQNIDDAFALAVWWTETNDGEAGVGRSYLNPGGVKKGAGYPSAADGYTIYPSYTAAVTSWFSMLQQRYISRGLTTVWSISHPYVGTSTSNLWAGKVVALMNRYRAQAPQPPATPTASVDANLARHAKLLAQQAQGQNSAPIVVPNQATDVQEGTTSSLNASTRLLLVLGDLLLALGISLVARTMLKRSSRSIQLASLLGDDLQERLRPGLQPSSALFQPAARTTERLAWPASVTGALTPAPAPLPISSFGSLFSLGTFLDTPADGYRDVPATEQLSFDAVTPFSDLANLPDQPRPRFAGSAPGLFHRTRLLPSDFEAERSSSLADAETDKLPQLVGAARASSFATPRHQPQPVGAGTGNERSSGLLSRYREMQEQSEIQQHFS